jgi:hypothetical protein
VEEDFIEDFIDEWDGTGTVEDTGDSERIVLFPGQYMESYTRHIGEGYLQILIDKYGVLGEGSPLVEYKDGDTSASCDADSWNVYSGPFYSQGWVKVRVSYP